PLAKKLNLSIDRSFESKVPAVNAEGSAGPKNGIPALRKELLDKPKYAGKTILISWRHSSIPELARALGAKDVPANSAHEFFHRVWQISYDSQGWASFLNRPQPLLPCASSK